MRRSAHLFQAHLELRNRTGQLLRLQPGEVIGSRHLDDAPHWAAVYGTLVAELQLIAAATRRPGHGLRFAIARHQLRLRYWEPRVCREPVTRSPTPTPLRRAS